MRVLHTILAALLTIVATMDFLQLSPAVLVYLVTTTIQAAPLSLVRLVVLALPALLELMATTNQLAVIRALPALQPTIAPLTELMLQFQVLVPPLLVQLASPEFLAQLQLAILPTPNL